MPFFSIQTNIEIANKGALLPAASQMVAEALGKPESYVMVRIDDGCAMCFAGSDAPLACLRLASLGLATSQTEALSARLCGWIKAQMGIDPARIYIEFSSPERAMWGWNRATF
ncbi:MAG: phenylpyruvate tautomerase MIF-related protein [Mariprofundales bacterium]